MKKGLWGIFKWCVGKTLKDSFEVSKIETFDRNYYGCSRVDYIIKISTLSIFCHKFDILVRFLTRKLNKAIKENMNK